MVFYKISSYCISCLLWCFIRSPIVDHGVLHILLLRCFIRYFHIVYLVYYGVLNLAGGGGCCWQH